MFPPKASCHGLLHISRSGYLTSLKATRYGEWTAIATIQVATMKNRHSFLLTRGERSGTTTATNRSTVIKTRLWMDTINEETSAKKICILHKAWPSVPPISHEPACPSARRTGNKNIALDRAGRTWPCLRSTYLSVFSKLVFCKQLIRWENFQPTKQQVSGWEQPFAQFLVFLDLSNWSSFQLLLCSCLLINILRQVCSPEFLAYKNIFCSLFYI